MSTSPGLQARRTTLAWIRTGIATAVPAALLVRAAVNTQSLTMTAAAALCVAGALGILGTGSRTIRLHRRVPPERRPCDYHGVTIVTTVTVIIAASTTISMLPW